MPPELPELGGVRHSYVDLPGFRAHVAEAGDAGADPVVLLHGWPQHWWCWRKVIPPLAGAGYRVIAPDLRGHGWSDAPAGGYGKEQFAADLIALLDALGLDRVKLVGHDWGGMTGFLACTRHPDRFTHFVALGIAPPWPSGDAKEVLGLWRLYYQVPLTAPLIAPLVASRPESIRLALRLGTHVQGAIGSADADAYAQAMAERPHVTLGIYRTFLTRELPAIVRGRYDNRRLEMPILHATGAHDPVVTPARIQGGTDHAPAMRKLVIEDAGHFVVDERPELVAALVRSELERPL